MQQTNDDLPSTHRKTRNNGEIKKQDDKSSSSKTNKKPNLIPNAEAILEDPYKIIAEPQPCCTLEDHKKKKNCKNNPWCCFGLGELREGIWSNKSNLYCHWIGYDLTNSLRISSRTDISSVNSQDLIRRMYGGLKNQGATCYINVFLQTIFHNVLFRDYIYHLSPTLLAQFDPTFRKLLESIQFVLYSLQSSANLSVETNRFTDVIGIDSYIQQDPQEFQNLFFSKLETIPCPTSSLISTFQMNRPSSSTISSNNPNLKWMYAGREKHVIKCLKCQKERFTCHEFNDLSIPIEADEAAAHSDSMTKAEAQQQRQLDDILQQHLFHNREILDEDNKIFCEHCKVATISERRIEILQFPPILCLHLLRYKYNRNTGNKIKIRSLLHFPPTITLPTDPQKQPTKGNKPEEITEYCLVSVIYHLGRSAHGGHYVCDVYDWKEKRWIHCDDEIITPIDADTLFNPTTISILDDEEPEPKLTAEGGKEKKPSTVKASNKKRKAKSDAKTSFHQKRKRMNPTREDLDDLSSDEIKDESDNDEQEGSIEDIGSSDSNDGYFAKEDQAKPKHNSKPRAKKGKPEIICLDGDDEDEDVLKAIADSKEDKKSKGNEEKVTESKAKESTRSTSSSSLFQRQRDVYMLYYVRKDVLNEPALLQKQLAVENDLIIKDVDANSRNFQEKVENYLQKKTVLQEQIEERKSLYNRIMDVLPAKQTGVYSTRKHSSQPEFHLLPSAWLKNWVVGDITTLPIWKDLEIESKSISKDTTITASAAGDKPIVMEIDDSQIEISTFHSAPSVEIISPPSNAAALQQTDEVQIIEGHSASSSGSNNQKKKAPSSVIGNRLKLCPHGYLNINCVEEMKIISHKAFTEIFQSQQQVPSFLMENLDFDLHQENYRCSLCYDQIIQKRQSILKEIETLQHIISQIVPYQQEQQKKSFQQATYNAGRPFYFLSSHSFTLLKKYLARLEKQQLSKTLQGNNEPIEISSSLPSSPDKKNKNSTNKELTMDMFYAKKNENGDNNETDENGDSTNGKRSKKNEIEFIRQEIFGTAALKKGSATDLTVTNAPPLLERINENLLCDEHQQLCLTYDKKSFLISDDIWKQIIKLFPDALSYPRPSRSCPHCTERMNKIHKENEEIKLLKYNEMQDEELIQLWKKKRNQKTSSSSSLSIPEDYRLLQERIDGKTLDADQETRQEDAKDRKDNMEKSKSKPKDKKKTKKRSNKETLDGFIVYADDPESGDDQSDQEKQQNDDDDVEMIIDQTDEIPIRSDKVIEKEFYLIDQDWLHEWRQYMNQSSSSTSSTPATAASKALKAPPLLTNAFLKCTKHGHLLTNLDVLETFAPNQHYSDLIKEQLLFELQESSASSNEVLRSLLEDGDLPRSIHQLPKAELVNKSQWNKLLYFHYKYHTFQQQAVESNKAPPKQTNKKSKSHKSSQAGSVLVNLHDDEDNNDEGEEEEESDNNQIQHQSNQQQPDPFVVKLLPTTVTSYDKEIPSFSAMGWDFLPSPCLSCLTDAFRQYFMTQQCFESENILTYVVADPILLIQLLQTLQEIHSEKKISSLSEEELDELFQSLVAKLSPTDGQDKDGTKETEKDGGGGGGDGNRRRSTRSRTTSMRKKYKKTYLLLSSNDNVAFMKLKILESLDIPYGASQLYDGHGQAMEAGTRKLSDYHFLANQALIVFDARCQRGDGAGNGDDSMMLMDDLDMFHEIDAAIPSQQGSSTDNNNNNNGGPGSSRKRGRKGQEGGFSGTIFSTNPTTRGANNPTTNPSNSNNAAGDREVIELFHEDSHESFPAKGKIAATPVVSPSVVKKEEPEDTDAKKQNDRRGATNAKATTTNTTAETGRVKKEKVNPSAPVSSSSRKRRKVEESDASEDEKKALAAVAALTAKEEFVDEDEDFLRAIEESKKFM